MICNIVATEDPEMFELWSGNDKLYAVVNIDFFDLDIQIVLINNRDREGVILTHFSLEVVNGVPARTAS